MIYKPILLKIGIITLPVFTYWGFQWIIAMWDFDKSLRSIFFDAHLIPMITLVIVSPLIILGLSVYLSIKIWIKYVHKK